MTTLDALRRGDLAGARELRLAGCGLTEVPQEVFALADTLEVLDLSGNALERLPGQFAKLKTLRALFCSFNAFTALPSVLGECPALSQIGCRGGVVREVSMEALPLTLRWLTLTDNHLEALPERLGERAGLQKLMLAGNRLRRLPESLAEAPSLELLRLSANRFEALPPWLGRLPRLAWLAWAGNPLEATTIPVTEATVAWSDLHVGDLLGEGASGRVYRADWRNKGADHAESMAVKVFKGAMTSDGLPACEMAACLAAGSHPHLIGGLGRVTEHPEGAEGLLMRLLPPHWRVLAGPPSLESCSRDVYPPEFRLSLNAACRIAHAVGTAAAHLHARQITHGDLYAHNVLWDGASGDAVLSDFGAASALPPRSDGSLERLEVLAWGLLFGELLDRCDDENPPSDLVRLQQACVQTSVAARPDMAAASYALIPFLG